MPRHSEPVQITQPTPSVTALVCTRNRGVGILCTAATILANERPGFELLIIDQSTDTTTEEALGPFRSDPRLRYVRTPTTGKGIALNIGLREARGEIVAITDDDCEVPADWLSKVAAPFESNPRVAVLYCNVIAPDFDPSIGFVPAYRRVGNQLVTRVYQRITARGIGAGMALRRQTALDLGGFDEMLGPGAAFADYEDVDIAVRALLKGYHVYETAEVEVVHHGLRTWAEGRELARRNYLGIGAGHAKYLKCGRFAILSLAAFEWGKFMFFPLFWDTIHLRVPPIAARASSYVRGFCLGMKTPVDCRSLLFRKIE